MLARCALLSEAGYTAGLRSKTFPAPFAHYVPIIYCYITLGNLSRKYSSISQLNPFNWGEVAVFD